MVSKEILDKFKSLYREKYNIILSEEEATELTTQFLTLMKILIMPEEKIDDIPNCLTE
jgi:hypothetical protein